MRAGAALLALAMSATAHAQTLNVAAVPADRDSGYVPPRAEAVAGVVRGSPAIADWKLSDVDERYWRSPSSEFRAAQVRMPPKPHAGRKGGGKSVAQRIAVIAGLSLGGFLAGGLLGAAIEGDSCRCDDPGLFGFVVGAPIGAGAGAAVGALLTR